MRRKRNGKLKWDAGGTHPYREKQEADAQQRVPTGHRSAMTLPKASKTTDGGGAAVVWPQRGGDAAAGRSMRTANTDIAARCPYQRQKRNVKINDGFQTKPLSSEIQSCFGAREP
jgi:hypothetical protein